MNAGKLAVIVALALSVLFDPLAAEAQQSARVYRIGLLESSAPTATRQGFWTAFRQQMGELGYVEGQSVSFEPRWATLGLTIPSLLLQRADHVIQ